MSPPAILKPAPTSSLPYLSFKNSEAHASGLSVWGIVLVTARDVLSVLVIQLSGIRSATGTLSTHLTSICHGVRCRHNRHCQNSPPSFCVCTVTTICAIVLCPASSRWRLHSYPGCGYSAYLGCGSNYQTQSDLSFRSEFLLLPTTFTAKVFSSDTTPCP